LQFLDTANLRQEIMGAQNLDSAPKFPQDWGLQHEILHFWTAIFQQEEDFLTIFGQIKI